VNTYAGGTISYAYDKASNLVSTTDSRGTTSYTFDASGTPTSLNYDTDLAGVVTPEVLTFQTDAQGRRTDEWLNASASNTVWGAHVHTSYDTSGRVTEVTAQEGSGDSSNRTIYDVSYCYNAGSAAPSCAAGTSTDHSKLQWQRNNLTGQVTSYAYDGNGRLSSATQSGGTASSNSTWTYTYDARGNRLTATTTGAGAASQTLTYNAANQITSTGYGYDAAGNLTADPSGSYTYNGAGQMTGVTQSGTNYSYAYAGTDQNEVLSETNPASGGGTQTFKIVYGRTDQQGQPVESAWVSFRS
jgi:YD repeat-containing protein